MSRAERIPNNGIWRLLGASFYLCQLPFLPAHLRFCKPNQPGEHRCRKLEKPEHLSWVLPSYPWSPESEESSAARPGSSGGFRWGQHPLSPPYPHHLDQDCILLDSERLQECGIFRIESPSLSKKITGKFPHSGFQHLPTCASFVNQRKCYLICPASWNTACSGDSRLCTAQPPLLLCAALPWKREKMDWFDKINKWCAFYVNACSPKVTMHKLWVGMISSDLCEIYSLRSPNIHISTSWKGWG